MKNRIIIILFDIILILLIYGAYKEAGPLTAALFAIILIELITSYKEQYETTNEETDRDI